MKTINSNLELGKLIYSAPISKTVIINSQKSFLQEYEDSGTGTIDPPIVEDPVDGATF